EYSQIAARIGGMNVCVAAAPRVAIFLSALFRNGPVHIDLGGIMNDMIGGKDQELLAVDDNTAAVGFWYARRPGQVIFAQLIGLVLAARHESAPSTAAAWRRLRVAALESTERPRLARR